MLGLGPTELIIILIIVIIIFGYGRIGKTLGELGSGLRAFKDGLNPEKKDDEAKQPANDETKTK
jgi:sec-independent protein translocase protein TatA